MLILLATIAVAVAACGGSQDADLTEVKTGFELRDGSDWTSLREEQDFLRELDAASEKVSVTEIGRSLEDRPIQLVTVGPPRTRQQIAAGTSALFVCEQHGSEPAGREACLQMARDAAGEMDASTLLVIPTANPDGLAVDERGNAEGTDINRDHMELSAPESEAIAAVMRDYKPDVVADFHEYKEEGESRVLLSNPDTLHLNVEPSIKELSGRLNEYAVDALDGDDFESGLYPSLSDDANEEVLRQQAALRHIPSLLVETPRRGTLSPVERVRAQRAAAGGVLEMLREETRRLASGTAASAREATAEGSDGDQRYYYRSPAEYTDSPPCAYELSEEEYRSVEEKLRLHGVVARFDRGSWRVPAAQPSQPLVGLLLDERAPEALTSGEPFDC